MPASPCSSGFTNGCNVGRRGNDHVAATRCLAHLTLAAVPGTLSTAAGDCVERAPCQRLLRRGRRNTTAVSVAFRGCAAAAAVAAAAAGRGSGSNDGDSIKSARLKQQSVEEAGGSAGKLGAAGQEADERQALCARKIEFEVCRWRALGADCQNQLPALQSPVLTAVCP